MSVTAEDIREGIVILLSAYVLEPQFQGQTKDRLNNPEMAAAVDGARDQAYNSLRNGDQSPPFTNPTNATYGQDTAFQKPRLVRVGARIAF